MYYRLNEMDFTVSEWRNTAGWHRTQLPESAGDCVTDRLQLNDGMTLIYNRYHPQQTLLETGSQERDERVLAITVTLHGHSATTGIDGQRFDFHQGHSTLAVFASVRGQRCFPAGEKTCQLRLLVEEHVLHQYQLAYLLPRPASHCAQHVAFGPSSPRTQYLAHTLVHLHDHEGSLLDYQIAALSLLSEQIRPLHASPIPTGRCRSFDQDKIRHARDILLAHFDRPLTIAYLCRVVGTNECTLKQGFRTLFGTSIHRMLIDIRMRKAWELLESGLNVSTVAHRIGYRHLASFSTAFAQYYDRTPKSVARGVS